MEKLKTSGNQGTVRMEILQLPSFYILRVIITWFLHLHFLLNCLTRSGTTISILQMQKWKQLRMDKRLILDHIPSKITESGLELTLIGSTPSCCFLMALPFNRGATEPITIILTSNQWKFLEPLLHTRHYTQLERSTSQGSVVHGLVGTH